MRKLVEELDIMFYIALGLNIAQSRIGKNTEEIVHIHTH